MQQLTELEKQQDSFQEKMKEFTEGIHKRMNSKTQNILNEIPEVDKERILNPNEEFEKEYCRIIGNNKILEEDEENNKECYDNKLE